MSKWRFLLPPFFLFFLSIFFYIHNISPSVYGGDVGDMLAAIAVKGVPHPSGYPLFTILGILFSYLPINQTLAWKVGLVSSLSASLAVVTMYFICFVLTKNKLVAFITACVLAFFYPFWLYAELGELFALNNFFELLLFLLGILYFKTRKIKNLYIMSFLLGLSLSHHQFIVLLFPTLFLLVFYNNWKVFFNLKTFFTCLFLLGLGLTPYLYIPIAASFNPPINWDHAHNLHNFIHLILRLDYGGVKPELSLDHATRFLSMVTYFRYIILELSPAVFTISILGAFYLIRKKQITLFTAIFLAFFLTGPFFFLYMSTNIHSGFTFGVLERFYMVSTLFLLLFFPFGTLYIARIVSVILSKVLHKNRNFYSSIFIYPFLVIPLFLFLYNFQRTDLHNIWIGDNLAYDFLSPLPKNSILLLGGDTALFNTLYLQYGRNIRKDVTVINFGTIFANPLFAYEREQLGLKKIPKEALDVATIEALKKRGPVFSLGTIQYTKESFGRIDWIPYGLTYKMINEDKELMEEEFLKQQDAIWKTFHIFGKKEEAPIAAQSPTLSDIYRIYGEGYLYTANYLLSKYNDINKAKDFYAKAISINPSGIGGYIGMGYYYFGKKDCNMALSMFRKAHTLNSIDRNVYVLLYTTYLDCFNKKEEAQKIANEYKKIFHRDIKDEQRDILKIQI